MSYMLIILDITVKNYPGKNWAWNVITIKFSIHLQDLLFGSTEFPGNNRTQIESTNIWCESEGCRKPLLL